MSVMLKPICRPCHDALRLRLRRKIASFEQLRGASTREHRLDVHTSDSNWASFGGSPIRSVLSHLKRFPSPSKSQQIRAQQFFERYKPKQLWVSDQWRKLPDSEIPEVAFVGRSNAGKSTLINSITCSKICQTGPQPGKTRELRAYGLTGAKPDGGAGKGGDMDFKIALLDTPGYGPSSIRELGEKITKYLNRRKQLRRVFVMINPEHGMKDHDYTMLQLLKTVGVPYQVIFTKVDTLEKAKNKKLTPSRNSMRASINTAILALQNAFQGRFDLEDLMDRKLDIGHGNILLSGYSPKDKDEFWKEQVNEIRVAIMQATGFDSNVDSIVGKPVSQSSFTVDNHVKAHTSYGEFSNPLTRSESHTEFFESPQMPLKGSPGQIRERPDKNLPYLGPTVDAQGSKIFENAMASITKPEDPIGRRKSTADRGDSSIPDEISRIYSASRTSHQPAQMDELDLTRSIGARLSAVEALLSIPKSTNRNDSKSIVADQSSSVDDNQTPSFPSDYKVHKDSRTSSSDATYKQVGGLRELEGVASVKSPSPSARPSTTVQSRRRSMSSTQPMASLSGSLGMKRMKKLTEKFEDRQKKWKRKLSKAGPAKESVGRVAIRTRGTKKR